MKAVCFSDVSCRASFTVVPAGSSVGVLMLDIDHFKSVNDKHGHQAGDTVLVEVARRFQQLALSDGFLARLGGEEFAILLKSADRETTVILAERLRRAICDTGFEIGECSLPVTISVGATIGDLRSERFDAVLQRADKALYCAKDNGRDRVVAF